MTCKNQSTDLHLHTWYKATAINYNDQIQIMKFKLGWSTWTQGKKWYKKDVFVEIKLKSFDWATCFATLLKSHFKKGAPLYISFIFLEYLFLRNILKRCFCEKFLILWNVKCGFCIQLPFIAAKWYPTLLFISYRRHFCSHYRHDQSSCFILKGIQVSRFLLSLSLLKYFLFQT